MYQVHRIDSHTDLSVDVTVRSACSGVKKHTAQPGCWVAPAMVVEGIGLPTR